jgi:hypothetical protein
MNISSEISSPPELHAQSAEIGSIKYNFTVMTQYTFPEEVYMEWCPLLSSFS